MDADADADDDDVVAAKNNISNNINHKSEGMVLKAKTVAEEEDIVVFEEVHVTESTKRKAADYDYDIAQQQQQVKKKKTTVSRRK